MVLIVSRLYSYINSLPFYTKMYAEVSAGRYSRQLNHSVVSQVDGEVYEISLDVTDGRYSSPGELDIPCLTILGVFSHPVAG
jgi:hypothetical protein